MIIIMAIATITITDTIIIIASVMIIIMAIATATITITDTIIIIIAIVEPSSCLLLSSPLFPVPENISTDENKAPEKINDTRNCVGSGFK